MERRAKRLATLEQWTEWPLTFLALVVIPLLIAPFVFALSDNTQSILTGTNYMIWGIFAVDFAVKIAISPNPLVYLRRHWFDAILVVVPIFRPLRAARSIRVLRGMRALLAGAALARVLIVGRTLLSRHGLHYVLAAVVVLIAAGGALVVDFERDHAEATIVTFPDGLWWAITTVTTVGYGDTFPRTAAGRGIGVAMMVAGITLFSALTANLAAFFVEQREDTLHTELREMRAEIGRLHALIASERAEK